MENVRQIVSDYNAVLDALKTDEGVYAGYYGWCETKATSYDEPNTLRLGGNDKISYLDSGTFLIFDNYQWMISKELDNNLVRYFVSPRELQSKKPASILQLLSDRLREDLAKDEPDLTEEDLEDYQKEIDQERDRLVKVFNDMENFIKYFESNKSNFLNLELEGRVGSLYYTGNEFIWEKNTGADYSKFVVYEKDTDVLTIHLMRYYVNHQTQETISMSPDLMSFLDEKLETHLIEAMHAKMRLEEAAAQF